MTCADLWVMPAWFANRHGTEHHLNIACWGTTHVEYFDKTDEENALNMQMLIIMRLIGRSYKTDMEVILWNIYDSFSEFTSFKTIHSLFLQYSMTLIEEFLSPLVSMLNFPGLRRLKMSIDTEYGLRTFLVVDHGSAKSISDWSFGRSF
jgi:hypothetical protein